MADSPRIEELRRRVQLDPASIAFAALAEEYRRAGRYEEAIDTCTAGLHRHPAYLSAHVTLGRALLEVGRYDEAQEELEHVLKLAPENLAAIRGLAEIQHRRGEEGSAALAPPEPAPAEVAPPAVQEASDNPLDALLQSAASLPRIQEPPAWESATFTSPPEIPQETPVSEPAVAEPPPDFHLELTPHVEAQPEVAFTGLDASDTLSMHAPMSDFTSEAAELFLQQGTAEDAPPTIVSNAPALAGLEEFLAAILRARHGHSSAR